MNALSRFHAFTSAHTHTHNIIQVIQIDSRLICYGSQSQIGLCVCVCLSCAPTTHCIKRVFPHDNMCSLITLNCCMRMLRLMYFCRFDVQCYVFFFSFDRMHILHPSWLSIRCLFDNRFSMRIKFFFPLLSPVIRSQNVLNKIAANFICFANVL